MFNKLLTHYRQRAGIKKTDLARKIDVSLTYIVSLESGRQKPPTRETCAKLADALSLNDKERRELIELAIINRIKSADLDTIRHSLVKTRQAVAITTDAPQRIPLLPWDQANKKITEDDIPVGLETISAETKAKENMFALKVKDVSMAPEFQVDDIVVIDTCPHPRDGDFVLAADTRGHEPLLRQFKDYGTTKILRPLAAGLKDIVLDQEKRYFITGKVIERVTRVKKY